MKLSDHSWLSGLPKNRQKLIILLPVFAIAYIVLAVIRPALIEMIIVLHAAQW